MKGTIGHLLDSVAGHIFPSEPEMPALGQTRPLADIVEQARQEWLTAQTYFESVSDPDLVDHAIYVLEAAERKYMYLLRKAKGEAPNLNADR